MSIFFILTDNKIDIFPFACIYPNVNTFFPFTRLDLRDIYTTFGQIIVFYYLFFKIICRHLTQLHYAASMLYGAEILS